MKKIILLFFFLVCLLNTTSTGQGMNLDSAIACLKTAKDDTNKVKLLKKISWDISYENSYKGLDYGLQAYKLAKKLNYNFGIAISATTIGTIYTDMGDYTAALIYFFEAIDIEKKYNYTNLLGKTYSNVGILFGKKREYNKSLNYYNLSVNCFKNDTLSRQLASTLNNIGTIYSDLHNYDSAKYFYSKALLINQHNKNLDNIAGLNINLGAISIEVGNNKEALIYVTKAINYFDKHPNGYNMAYAKLLLANIYLKLNDFDNAILNCYLVLNFSEKAGVKDLSRDAYICLSGCYEKKNDNVKALFFHKKYTSIKDTLLSDENNKRVHDLELNYETDKKNKEIELLTQKSENQTLEADKRKIIWYATLVGLIISVLLALVLYNRSRLKHKANEQLTQTNFEISTQKEIIEIKNKEITDSINYAQRIQRVLLTSDKYIKKYIAEFFILNKPKDIVSGDFYWAVEANGCFIMVTADCTGHGVPGAFMSLLGINFLNEIVIEQKITQPDLILNALRLSIIEALNPEGSSEAECKDGMDLVLCKYDFKNMQLSFACANNPLWLFRNNMITEFKADKMPVGVPPKEMLPFTLQTLPLEKNDIVYTLTDGYADQFGGTKGKKFMYKQLKEVIALNLNLPLAEQKNKLDANIKLWQGNLEQVDDMLVIGVKI